MAILIMLVILIGDKWGYIPDVLILCTSSVARGNVIELELDYNILL